MKLVLKANIEITSEKATADEKVFKILRRWDTNTVDPKPGARQILKNLPELSPKIKKEINQVLKNLKATPETLMDLGEDVWVDFLSDLFVALNKSGYPVKNRDRFLVD